MGLCLQLEFDILKLLHLDHLLVLHLLKFKHLFSLFENIFAHFHCLLEVLIAVLHYLLQGLLIQHDHLLLVVEKLAGVVLRWLQGLRCLWGLVDLLSEVLVLLREALEWLLLERLLLVLWVCLRMLWMWLHVKLLRWLKLILKLLLPWLELRVNLLLPRLILKLLGLLMNWFERLFVLFKAVRFAQRRLPLLIAAFELAPVNHLLRFIVFECPSFTTQILPLPSSQNLSLFFQPPLLPFIFKLLLLL